MRMWWLRGHHSCYSYHHLPVLYWQHRWWNHRRSPRVSRTRRVVVNRTRVFSVPRICCRRRSCRVHMCRAARTPTPKWKHAHWMPGDESLERHHGDNRVRLKTKGATPSPPCRRECPAGNGTSGRATRVRKWSLEKIAKAIRSESPLSAKTAHPMLTSSCPCSRSRAPNPPFARVISRASRNAPPVALPVS